MKIINNFLKGLQKNVRIRSTLYLVFLLGLTVGIVVKVALVYGVTYTFDLNTISTTGNTPTEQPPASTVAPKFNGLVITDQSGTAKAGIDGVGSPDSLPGSIYTNGYIRSSIPTNGEAAISGNNSSTTPLSVGVAGYAPSGRGVQGDSGGYGVYASTNGTSALASAGLYATSTNITTVPAIMSNGHVFIQNGNLEFKSPTSSIKLPDGASSNLSIWNNTGDMSLSVNGYLKTNKIADLQGINLLADLWVKNGAAIRSTSSLGLEAGTAINVKSPSINFTDGIVDLIDFSCADTDPNCRTVDFRNVNVLGLTSGSGPSEGDGIFDNITVTDTATLNKVKISGNTDINNGKITLTAANGDATFSGGLTIKGISNFKNSSNATTITFWPAKGDGSFGQDLTVGRNLTVGGTTTLRNTTLNGTLTTQTIKGNGGPNLATLYLQGDPSVGNNQVVVKSPLVAEKGLIVPQNGVTDIDFNNNDLSLNSGYVDFSQSQLDFHNAEINLKEAQVINTSGATIDFNHAHLKNLDQEPDTTYEFAKAIKKQIYMVKKSDNGEVLLRCNNANDVLLSCNGKSFGYALERVGLNNDDECDVKLLNNSTASVEAEVICLKASAP